MRNRMQWLALAVLGLSLLAVGCAQPPKDQMDSAKQAMSAAQQAGAPEYAPDAWDKAQKAMNAAQAEVDAQNAKFALFRSYKNAKDLLSQATTAANDAKTAGETAKKKAQADAQAALDAVKGSISQAEDLMGQLEKCRRKPKGFAQDMEQLSGTLDGLKKQEADAESAMTSGDYNKAKSQAESLKGQADSLVTDLTNAKKKIHC
ncbi:MAG TPA: DUF4398 domain-containing protein [Thermoanaerobaculia bacterium]|nr:DUF4398 domain-containing protein [Thermoanaerobaculia bacterium]